MSILKNIKIAKDPKAQCKYVSIRLIHISYIFPTCRLGTYSEPVLLPAVGCVIPRDSGDAAWRKERSQWGKCHLPKQSFPPGRLKIRT